MDRDVRLIVRGANWHPDPFHNGAGADGMLTLFGVKQGIDKIYSGGKAQAVTTPSSTSGPLTLIGSGAITSSI